MSRFASGASNTDIQTQPSFFGPFPAIKTSDEIVECTALIPILKWRHSKLFKRFQGFEDAKHNFLCEHLCQDFAVLGGHALEKKIDFVLIGKEPGRCVLVPYSQANTARSDLSLTVVTYTHQFVDDVSVCFRLSG